MATDGRNACSIRSPSVPANDRRAQFPGQDRRAAFRHRPGSLRRPLAHLTPMTIPRQSRRGSKLNHRVYVVELATAAGVGLPAGMCGDRQFPGPRGRARDAASPPSAPELPVIGSQCDETAL